MSRIACFEMRRKQRHQLTILLICSVGLASISNQYDLIFTPAIAQPSNSAENENSDSDNGAMQCNGNEAQRDINILRQNFVTKNENLSEVNKDIHEQNAALEELRDTLVPVVDAENAEPAESSPSSDELAIVNLIQDLESEVNRIESDIQNIRFRFENKRTLLKENCPNLQIPDL